jgi:hypothetical protein
MLLVFPKKKKKKKKKKNLINIFLGLFVFFEKVNILDKPI